MTLVGRLPDDFADKPTSDSRRLERAEVLFLRRLDKLGICVGDVLGLIVEFPSFLVAFPYFGEQVEGFLAIVLEGGIFVQDAVELYLLALGGELGVHRL